MAILAGVFGLLGLLFWLVALLGLISPKLFTDKKTGEVPTRGALGAGGVVAGIVAFVIAGWLAPDEISAGTTPSAKLEASAPAVVAVEASAASEEKPGEVAHKQPLALADARLFATGTLRIINEAEQSLNDGIQLGDGTGITRHVWRPLQAELDRWPNLMERHPNDQREHFAYCQDAALKLQLLSGAVKRERTVESMKYLRKDEAEYRKAKQRCEQQLQATDSQIKAAVAAEDAELKKKFGGRDCLTVYGVDKQTGQVVEQPKPAHCKA